MEPNKIGIQGHKEQKRRIIVQSAYYAEQSRRNPIKASKEDEEDRHLKRNPRERRAASGLQGSQDE